MPDLSSAPATLKPWRLPDIANLEFFLQRAAPIPAPSENIRRQIASPGGDTPSLPRAAGFRLWLDEQVENHRESTLPGESLQAGLKTASFLLSLLAFLGGIGLVLSLLDRAEKAFNVQIFFAAAILSQLLLLLLLFAGWLLRKAFAESGALSIFHQAVRGTVACFTRRFSRDGGHGETFSRFYRGYRNLIAWPVIGISQTVAIFFNLGLLAGFFGCLLFLDLSFYWESTFGARMDQILYRITDAVALPWSWLRPDWTPSFELIQDRGIGNTGNGVPGAGQAWYPFLLCSLLVWGLLPRVVLRAAAAVRGRRALARFDFNQRPHRELWRQLTAVDVHADVELPSDGTVVLNWNGIEVDPDELHGQLIQQLRLNPVRIQIVGTDSSEHDILTLRSLAAAAETGTRLRVEDLTVLAEAWGLVPRRMQEFHRQIRDTFGDALPVRYFLIGNPASTTRFTPPTDEDVRVWEEFLDTLHDPHAEVRPFRG